jgi:predicted phage tail protein
MAGINNNLFAGVNAAFAQPAAAGIPEQAKKPSERELREEARRNAQFQSTVLAANVATGGRVNADVLAKAQERLTNGASPLQAVREGGGNLQEQAAQIPQALASEQTRFQIMSATLNSQQAAIGQEYQQLALQIQEAEAQGLVPDPSLAERMNQLADFSKQIEAQGKQLEEDSAANVTALMLRADQIAEARKQKAQQTQAFLKDAGSKAGQNNQKPVKVRPANFTIESGDESGE